MILFKHGSLQGTMKHQLVLTWKDFVGGAEEAEKLHKLGKSKSPNLNEMNPGGILSGISKC